MVHRTLASDLFCERLGALEGKNGATDSRYVT